jgi:tetratricopeptide (TPR) repeat protein
VADESLAVAWEIREASPIYFVSAWAAIAYLKLGRPEDAARLLHRALREGPAAGPFFLAYPHIALAQLRFSSGELGAALDAATRAIELADNSGFRLEQGAARRVLGQVHDARASSEEADGAFRQSLDILESIQASPELAQTLLAYGRFKARNDPATGEEIIRRALRIFEATGATGWLEEARAALQALA